VKVYGMLLVLLNHLAYLPTMGFERHLLLAHCMWPSRFRPEGYSRHAWRMTGYLALLFVLVNGASLVLLRVPLLTGFTPVVWIVLMWCRPWAIERPVHAACLGATLFLAGMYPYVLRPANVFQEHFLNGLNDLAFALLIPWVRGVLENKRITQTITLACGVLPVTLILADLMVMRYCQLDSLLIWAAFLGFVAAPPKWLMDPPRSLWWLGKYSLTIYGLSFLPFLLRWYPTGLPSG
jgi:hypothetical protein